MAIEYNFTLDMDRSKRDNNIAYARTGDVDSITINADLVFNGAAYTPTGTNAFFECITPNGCSIRAAAEKTGSTVSVDVPSAAFQAAGVINVAYFRFESGEADNPTYVESTEPFAIVVREGIGDNIDTGNYIEEWRQLADHLEAVVTEVEQKAEQAEAAINEQKIEVDQLKAQAQTAIAGDVTEVEEVAQSVIAAINKEKANVADAAEGVTAAGDQAISKFKTDSQQAVDKFNEDSQQAVDSFNTNGTSAINKFNTDGTSAIDHFNTDADSKLGEVDDMITEAQGDVDAAVTQLENETQNAIKVAQDVLDGTTAANLRNAINRTLKLDVADMTNIPDNSSLSSFTNVGSYCCKTAATAATVGDCPVDDSSFNMYVFSSATPGQVMQLVIPIDLNGKPTAEWHVRFGTSSAMDPWSVIGGGADIAAGLGIDVTGDTQKTVSLDTNAFYQHYGAANIIQGSTEVTGGGRVKELRVKGKTWVNRWPVINSTKNGVTVSTDETGLITVTGTSTSEVAAGVSVNAKAGSYSYLVSQNMSGTNIQIQANANDSNGRLNTVFATSGTPSGTGVAKEGCVSITCTIVVESGKTVNTSFRVMLVDGTEAPDCFTPCASITSVQPENLVTSGKNLIIPYECETLASNGITATKLDDGGYLLSGTASHDAYININFSVDEGIYGQSFQPNVMVTASMNDVSGVSFHGGFREGQNSKSISGSGFNAGQSVTSPKNAKVMYCFLRVLNGTTLNNVTVYPQLELGSTATAYEPPNITQTTLPEAELRGLPNGTCDELVIRADGSCEVERRTGAWTFDGSENWAQDLAVGGVEIPYFSCTFSGTSEKIPEINWGGCNDRLPTENPYTYGGDCFYIFASGFGYIARIRKSGCDDVASIREWLASNNVNAIYGAVDSTELQSPVTLPALPAPTFNQYHDADIPTEIEAEVVKVDYLPAPDVYTREEVDKKIEASGMPEIVPVSHGGTGVTTAAAERNRLGLGNTTGALPVANGGTGAATAKAAEYNILGSMITDGSDPEDTSDFAMVRGEPSSEGGVLFKRKGTSVWNWIASKIRNTFGFNSGNVLPVANGGTGCTSAKAAQNSLLNDMDVSSDPLADSSMLVGYNASPSATDGAVHKRSVTTVWDYIAGKVADKVWDKIKTKAISGDTATGTDLTLTGGLKSTSQIRTSMLTLGVNEMSFANSNAAPLTVNGEEVITEGNISSHLPVTFDAKSVRFSTPLKQGQQKNIITEGGFTLEELRKYFVPGNLVLANIVCGGDRGQQLDKVVPMVINIGDGKIMQSAGITYDSLAEDHYDCIFAVANNEQAGGGSGTGLADGVTMLYSVTETPSYVDRTSSSSLRGFTVFDLVSHSI